MPNLTNKELALQNAILSRMKEFCEAWRKGDILLACQVYGIEASLIYDGELVSGRSNILAKYSSIYLWIGQSVVSLALADYTPISTENDGRVVARADFIYHLKDSEGKIKSSGHSMLSFIRTEDTIFIAEDITA